MKPPEIKSTDEIKPVTPDWVNEVDTERYPASMEYWYPRLQQVDEVTTPDTAWVALEPDKIHEGTRDEYYWAEYNIEELRNAVKKVGGPPAFLCTDMASNIYDMETSHITALDDEHLNRAAGGVLNFNVIRAEIPFCSFAVREWLDIKHFFTAWGGKKIGVEIRAFVSNGSVDGWCFDWPKNQLKPDTEGWEDEYERTMNLAESRGEEVIPMAQAVAEQFKNAGTGEWSVDFVLTENDEWYCTDMAPKRMSQVSNDLHEV